MTSPELAAPLAAPDAQSNILQGTHVLQRFQTLQAAGHGNLALDVQAGLVQQPTSDQQMTQQAGALQGALNSSQTFLGTVFDDPVLHKAPSLALTLHRYITGTMGWLPVAESDLNHVQRQLQGAGFGKGLNVNGVWDGGWSQAYSEYTNAYHKAQLAGEHGSSGGSFWSGVGHFFSALLPSHAIPAIIGFIKSIPGDVRQVVADVGGAAAGVYHDVSHLTLGHDAQTMANASASIENFLGGDVSPHEVRAHQVARIVGDFGNLLAVAPVLKAGSAVADAAGEAISKGVFTDLGAQAAQRGPGTVAGLLYRSPRYYTDADGALKVLNPGGALSAKFLDNMPVIRRAIPAVRTATDKSQTFYYTARTALAQPYRIAGVQAAGTAAQQALTAGAAVRGVAALETALGGRDNPLPTNVYNEHVMTGPVARALDLASAAFHGPLGAKPLDLARTADEATARAQQVRAPVTISPSQSAGDLVRGAQSVYDGFLGQLGARAQFELGTGLNYDSLVKQIGQPAADEWINTKINQFAASISAHKVVDPQGLTGQAFFDALRDEEHKVWTEAVAGNPARLVDGRNQMLTDFTAGQQAFHRDSNIIEGDPRADYAKGIAAWSDARKSVYRLLADHSASLITPAAVHAVSEARQEHTFLSALGQAEGPAPDLTASYMAANPVATPAGSIGMARVESQTKADAARFADRLRERLTAAGVGADGTPILDADGLPAAVDKAAVSGVKRDAYRYLVQELGAHPQYLDGKNASRLADEITKRGDSLASDVYLALGADPAAAQLAQQVKAAGYKLVYGTDIGHAFAPPLIDPVVIDGQQKALRKIANTLGMSDVPVSTQAAAQQFRLEAVRLIQRAINNGEIKAPPGYNAARLLQHLDENLASKLRLRKGEQIAMRIPGLSRGLERQAADAVRAKGMDPTADRIADQLTETEKGLAAGTSPLDVSPREFTAALTSPPPGVVNEMRGEADTAPLMSQRDAELMHRLYLTALLKRPKWMMGGLLHTDAIRGGMAWLGATARDVPVVGRAAMKVSALPNDLVRFRNRYRFTLDPMFSARRVAKTMVKTAVEGAPATLTPYATMVKQGTLQDDLRLLNRLYPENATRGEGFDALDQMLWHADAFGIYNPRHYMALLAGTLKRAGLDDAAVKAKVERATTYGERTAMERTVGTVFYPFSFEKTLYRNLGAALLDHPGQRFLTYAAVDGYHALSKKYNLSAWIDAHLPILTELSKVNAFAHGLGPGELGGINAPYASVVWNAFGPQHITNPHAGYDVLTNAFPVLRELNSMLLGYNPTTGKNEGGTLVQQAQVTYWAARNAIDDTARFVTSNPRSPFNPQHPAETTQAQVEDGWRMRTQLITQLVKVIDYNYHHRGAEYTFPANYPISAVAGRAVSKTTVSEIVHTYYPSFNPEAAAKLAQGKKIEAQTFLANLQHSDPARAAAYSAFAQAADKAASYLSKDQYNTTTAARVIGQFRQYAVAVSEQDPAFYQFYRTYYANSFGPLESLTT